MEKVRYLNGYRLVYRPSHPKSMKSDNWNGWIYEHILIGEKKIGRSLREQEEVHHLDLDRSNNRPENVLVLEKSQHTTLHNWLQRGAPISKEIVNRYPNATLPKTKPCGNPSCSNKVKDNRSYCSNECRSVQSRVVSRPDKTQLENDIANMSWVSIGRKYGVSDNAVRKWAKGYGIE